MIKPNEVNPNAPVAPVLNPDNLIMLERQFDDAIKAGRWPAVVPNDRDGATPSEVEYVAERYRAEGWKVMTGNANNRAVIDHPNRIRA